jgi:WD40 repeat protein
LISWIVLFFLETGPVLFSGLLRRRIWCGAIKGAEKSILTFNASAIAGNRWSGRQRRRQQLRMKDGVLKIKNHPGWCSVGLLIFASELCCAQQAASSSNPPELVVQTGHSDKVTSLTFSPDGKTLASSGEDNTIKFWDLSTGEELRTIRHGMHDAMRGI